MYAVLHSESCRTVGVSNPLPMPQLSVFRIWIQGSSESGFGILIRIQGLKEKDLKCEDTTK